MHRVAALRGLIKTDDARASSIIVDLLKGDDSYLRQAALRCLVMDRSEKLSMAAAGPGLPTSTGFRALAPTGGITASSFF